MYEQGVNQDGITLRDAYVVHAPVDIDCSHDGRTRQEFAEECDINVLMSTYEKTGLPFNDRPAEFLDVSDIPDLHSAMIAMDKAQAAFMSLPAATRREFDNDPVKFVAFAEDPKNLERMREWGLAAPEKVEDPPIKVEVTNQPPPEKAP